MLHQSQMTSVVNSINIQYVRKSNAIPGQGNKISHAMWFTQNVKKKKNRKSITELS